MTNDGGSWAPVWSPAGDAIAFFHIEGQIVDLRMAVLDGRAPEWTVKEVKNLTEVSGLDGSSRPGWFIPAGPAPGHAGPEPARLGGAVVRGPVTGSYLERLGARSAAVGSVLCVGLDPDPTALPDGFSQDLAGVERFCGLLVEAAAPYAAAFKPNLAFFEAFGSRRAGRPGTGPRARSRPDIPVVADAKRGDIGSTAARQAVALFDGLGADAVTVNPYLGSEAVMPLLERLDRFAYLLCRTSNPGAGELQDLDVPAAPIAGAPAEPLYARVARLATRLGPRRDRRPRRRRHRALGAGRHPGHRARARVPRAGRRGAGRGSGAGARLGTGHGGPGRRASGRRPARQHLARDRLGRRRRRPAEETPARRCGTAAREWSRRLPVLP